MTDFINTGEPTGDFTDHQPVATPPSDQAVLALACSKFCAGNGGRTPEGFANAVKRNNTTALHLLAVAKAELSSSTQTGVDATLLAAQIRGVAAGGSVKRNGTVSGGRRE